MMFILTVCFCILAFSKSLKSTNKQLRRTNEVLLETLRELAVGATDVMNDESALARPSESAVGDLWITTPKDKNPGECRPAGSVTNSEAWCDLRSTARCSKCRYGYYWYWGSTYCCTDDMYQEANTDDCKCEYKNE